MTDIDRIIAAGFVFFGLICTVCALCFILVHLYMHFKNRIAKLEHKNEKLQAELYAKEKNFRKFVLRIMNDLIILTPSLPQ